MTMPAGAQVSPDGHYWWDVDAQVWQLVVPAQAAAPAGHGQPAAGHEQPGGGHDQPAGGQEPASAEFIFDTNGLWVSPDDTDNPDNHAVLHHDAGTQVSFLVWNAGAGKGTATVTIYIDDQQVQTWTSGEVEPGQSKNIDGDGFVHSCGRHPAGRHVFRAIVTPGHSGGGDDTTNEVDIE